MTEAILQEIEIRKDYLEGIPISSIYFGGGTPSIMPTEAVGQIIDLVNKHHDLVSGVEITIETNPDDLNAKLLSEYSALGINRLSIGVQSFNDVDLIQMNRSHCSRQAVSSIQMAQDLGITNLNIDLIFGGNTTTDEVWLQNLELAIQMQIPHLSCYALTIEPGTVFHRRIQKLKMESPDSSKFNRQFYQTKDVLENYGYEHYEISNYAMNRQYTNHNSAYWFNQPYLGIGPSAHSYDIQSREWNIPNNKLYIDSVMQGKIPSTREQMSPIDLYNEFIMTRLRTKWGIDEVELESRFPREANLFRDCAKAFIDRGQIKKSSEKYHLSREGLIFADSICSDLFLV